MDPSLPITDNSVTPDTVAPATKNAVGNVEIIDVDDYPDVEQSSCAPQTSGGIRFVCVDPQCPKHRPKHRPRDLGTIDLCLSSDDEDPGKDTNADATSANQGVKDNTTQAMRVHSEPSASISSDSVDIDNAIDDMEGVEESTNNLEGIKIIDTVTMHMENTTNNVEGMKTIDIVTTHTENTTNNMEGIKTIDTVTMHTENTTNNMEGIKTIDTVTTHTENTTNNVNIFPNQTGSAATNGRIAEVIPVPESLQESIVNSPTSLVSSCAVHGVKIKSEPNSPHKFCPVHSNIKVKHEEKEEKSNGMRSDFDAEQLRDKTKLGRNIVDKYYDILVQQPIVTLEPVNLKHVLDDSQLRSFENKKKNIVKKDCPFCEKTFVFEKSLVYHVNMYHQKSSMPFKCVECDMGFFKSISLKIHMMRKHPEYTTLEECNICHKFYRKSFLARHIKNKHTEHKPIICDQCDAAVLTATDLLYHKKIFHNKKQAKQGGIGWKCKRCQKCSSVLSVDNTCKMCASDIVQSPNIPTNDPVDVSTSNVTLNCPQCQTVFIGAESRDRHYRSNHDEKTMPYHCSVCQKGFLSSSVMENHLSYIHKRSTRLKVTGPIRPMLRDMLRKQKNGESIPKGDDDKTLCPSCKGRFVHQRLRDAHFRDIHGEDKMPYHCDVCSKGYFHLLVLLKHYRLSHPEDFKIISRSLDQEESRTLTTQVNDIVEVDVEQVGQGTDVLVRSGHLPCSACGKLFGEMSKRDKHFRRMHDESKMPFKCSKCNTGYLSEISLKGHKASYCKYKQVRAMMAPIKSPAKRKDEPSLEVAPRTVHDPALRHLLSSPPKSTTPPRSQEQPVEPMSLETRVWRSRPDSPGPDISTESPQAVTNEKPVCDICGKAFLTIHGLGWHVKEKHPNQADVNRPQQEQTHSTSSDILNQIMLNTEVKQEDDDMVAL